MVATPAAAQSTYGALGVTFDDGVTDLGATGRIGHDLNSVASIEADATYLFGPEVGTIAGFVKGRVPVTPRITLHGRLGYGFVRNGEFDIDDDAFAYGLGAEAALSARNAVRIDWTKFDAGGGGSDGLLTLSYSWRFGGR